MSADKGLDTRLKRLFPTGMRESIDIEIRLHCGFELQNTRPYHNYETWSHEWRAVVGDKTFLAETLDELVSRLEGALAK